jgi:hypothetical protein
VRRKDTTFEFKRTVFKSLGLKFTQFRAFLTFLFL